MLIVGLTGGIGSGKTTVSAQFAAQGVPVIDTDAIAHRLTSPGAESLSALRRVFGDAIFSSDGALDRAALRDIVFKDSGARGELEAILHPRIRAAVEQSLAGLDAPYCIVVVPLLVETGAYRDLLHRILVVDAPEALQIARVVERSRLAREEVDRIMAAQASRTERLACADDVIDNTGAEDRLREAVLNLHQRYLDIAAADSP